MLPTITNFDHATAIFFYGFFGNGDWYSVVIRFIAKWGIYVVPVGFVTLWLKQKKYLILLRAFFAGLFSWQILSGIIGFFWFRPRPFSEALLGKQEFLFHRPDHSFPSDHAALLAGIYFAFLFFNEKKYRQGFLIYTVAISLLRIMVGAHYLTDVLAGWLVGLVGAYIIKCADKYLQKWLYEPLIKIWLLIISAQG